MVNEDTATLTDSASAHVAKAAEDFAACLHMAVAQSMESQVGDLEQRVERLEAGSGGVTDGDGTGAVNDERLGQKIQNVVSSVLIESGVLESLIEKVVDSRGGAPLATSGADGEGLQEEAKRLTKQFLSENLATIFKSEIHKIVESQVAEAMASETVKTMIDGKFRSVSLYLTTDVIPKAVRQVMEQNK